MPKHPQLESFKHQFLLCCKAIAERERVYKPNKHKLWVSFISSLSFAHIDSSLMTVSWAAPSKGTIQIKPKNFNWRFPSDASAKKNGQLIMVCARKICRQAGFTLSDRTEDLPVRHFAEEEKLFDAWAMSTDPKTIDVIQANEACTAPEMRYISQQLGDIKGKKLLDVGCGLGEASVYFSLKGAHVTALDLSSEMLKATHKLAEKYKTKVSTVQVAIEHLNIPKSKQFDIIYGGNIFHHVHIPSTLNNLMSHLAPGGTLVCWEPVAYNPLINIYRKIATQVRSADERPFTMEDIKIFRSHFKNVHTKWFWLTTLILFCYMIVGMGRNPNKIRLWKEVIYEESYWKSWYVPLEMVDTILLSIFPFLGPLCWNVVLICTASKNSYR